MSVAGQVTTAGDQAISSGVTVLVERYDGVHMGEVSADQQGHFQFDILPSGRRPYRMTVKAEGYNTIQQMLDVRAAAGTISVQVILTPALKGKSETGPLPALTDMSAPRKAHKAIDEGVRALEAHRLPDAERHFSDAIAQHPCYARAYNGLAVVHIAKRDLGAAEAELRKAIQCDPGFPDAFVSLGRVLNSEMRFTESESILQQGLRLSPKTWELYDQLAAAHYNLGSYSQAAEEWLQVESMNRTPPAELHAKLSAAYLREGKPEEAHAEMEVYLRAEPQGRFAAQLKSLMRQMESSGAVSAPADQTAEPRKP